MCNGGQFKVHWEVTLPKSYGGQCESLLSFCQSKLSPFGNWYALLELLLFFPRHTAIKVGNSQHTAFWPSIILSLPMKQSATTSTLHSDPLLYYHSQWSNLPVSGVRTKEIDI